LPLQDDINLIGGYNRKPKLVTLLGFATIRHRMFWNIRCLKITC